MKIKSVTIVFLFVIFFSCVKNERKVNIEIFKDNNNEILLVNESYNEIYENGSSVIDTEHATINSLSITKYFYDEILDGNMLLSFTHDANGVKDFFGEPLEETITPTSFYFEGGTIIEICEYVYDDFIHYYYFSENGYKLYKGFSIAKPLERLKTINIGDTSEKLLLVFSDKYFTWAGGEQTENNISYYTDPVVCEIQFSIKDKIIEMIFCNFLSLSDFLCK